MGATAILDINVIQAFRKQFNVSNKVAITFHSWLLHLRDLGIVTGPCYQARAYSREQKPFLFIMGVNVEAQSLGCTHCGVMSATRGLDRPPPGFKAHHVADKHIPQAIRFLAPMLTLCPTCLVKIATHGAWDALERSMLAGTPEFEARQQKRKEEEQLAVEIGERIENEVAEQQRTALKLVEGGES